MPSCPADLSGGSSAIASFTSSRVGCLLSIASGVEVSVDGKLVDDDDCFDYYKK